MALPQLAEARAKNFLIHRGGHGGRAGSGHAGLLLARSVGGTGQHHVYCT
jgi:hypothetical protein